MSTSLKKHMDGLMSDRSRLYVYCPVTTFITRASLFYHSCVFYVTTRAFFFLTTRPSFLFYHSCVFYFTTRAFFFLTTRPSFLFTTRASFFFTTRASFFLTTRPPFFFYHSCVFPFYHSFSNGANIYLKHIAI